MHVDRSLEAQGKVSVLAVDSAGAWQLNRSYVVDDSRLLVFDDIKTGAAATSVVGIATEHRAFLEAGASAVAAVLPGSLYAGSCWSDQDRGNFGAPQVWMRETSGASVGLVPLDDVFRVHAVSNQSAVGDPNPRIPRQTPCPTTDPPSVAIGDPMLAIARGSSYQAEWAVYVGDDSCSEYACFVNSLRRDYGTDQITIPGTGVLGIRCSPAEEGCTDMAYQNFLDAGYTDAEWERWGKTTLAEFAAQQGAFLPTDNEDWIPGGPCGFRDVDGAAFVHEMPPDMLTYLKFFASQLQNAGGAKGLVYTHTHISTGVNDTETYKDCAVTRSNGTQVFYVECVRNGTVHYDAPLFYGTTSNAYGKVLDEYIDKVLALGFHGIYHDEFGTSSVAYTYDTWDNVTAILDDNNAIVALPAHLQLLTLDHELAMARKVVSAGGHMFANGAPLTMTWMREGLSVHFAETSVMWRTKHVQTYTPLMLNRYAGAKHDPDPKYNATGVDYWGNLLDHLDDGVLSFGYDTMLRNDSRPSANRFMFPITPVELGGGFVRGRERVVTKVNATFTAGQEVPPSVASAVVYTFTEGFLTAQRAVASRSVPVVLAPREVAVIVWKEGE